ncbi:MAG TPA: XrtA system polysaccharide deacetylase [Gemmataceae bacterium]|nr:XrtA system polysaccharide deacetylase [Gemmataceae bacterium]
MVQRIEGNGETAAPPGWNVSPSEEAGRIILSFDVEEHFRIEAAAGLVIDPALKAHYSERLEPSVRWLLDQLGRRGIRATFFVVGEIGRDNPDLIRAIHRAGHELASHSWDHRRVHHLTPAAFREDLRRTKDTFEQITGVAVVGYRAPTFSIMRPTAWAIDVLAELGLLYDSSIYPVRHDRYGVPQAPRGPFLARGAERSILELPPALVQLGGVRIPAGGGGYFRLLPLRFLELAIRQVRRACRPPVATLYFHPWEFDPDQPRLPLRRLSRFRTYVGIRRSRGRLTALLDRYRFVSAVEVARELDRRRDTLPTFALAE